MTETDIQTLLAPELRRAIAHLRELAERAESPEPHRELRAAAKLCAELAERADIPPGFVGGIADDLLQALDRLVPEVFARERSTWPAEVLRRIADRIDPPVYDE